MGALFAAVIRPSWRHKPWQSLLAILGIALGVTVVVGIDLAAAAALQSFRGAIDVVAGNTTHQIRGMAGGVPETLFREVLLSPEVEAATPVIETTVQIVDAADIPLSVLGVDPFLDYRFRPYSPTRETLPSEVAGDLFIRFLTEPNTLVLSRATAERAGLVAGDSITVRAGTTTHAMTILALFDPAGPAGQSGADLAIVDIATAQELTGRLGALDRIDCILPGDPAQQETHAAALQALLPEGLVIERPATRSARTEQLIGAFRLNLQALSLLALFVGVFLIYNTMLFALVQRRRTIGVIRALGAAPEAVLWAFLLEAAIFGILGTLLGLLLGTALAQHAVRLVAQTISDHWAAVRVTEAPLTALATGKAVLLGLGAALIAAWYPAREAAATPPRLTLLRSELERRTVALLPGLALAGALFLIGATALTLLPRTGLGGGFGAVALTVFGFICFTPHLVIALARWLRPMGGALGGMLGQLALGNVAGALSRTGVAIAALMVALAMTIGVATMIQSFRKTVDRWVRGTIIAEVYIRPIAQEVAGFEAFLPEELFPQLEAIEGVRALSYYRGRELVVDDRPVILAAISGPLLKVEGDIEFLDADPQAAWRALEEGAVVVSEPFARKFALGAGDSIDLPTPQGPQAFPIAGTFYDYTADRGVLMMDRAIYQRVFHDTQINSLALFLDDPTQSEAVAEAVRRTLAGPYGLYVASNRELRNEVFAIFDRTFAVTTIMQGLAATVAFVGVLSALLSLLLERTREFGILRALGASWRDLGRMLALETGFMGLVASLVAMPCGLLLSYLLITVINLRSFGWTIRLQAAPTVLLEALLLALGASLLAAVIPILRLRSQITAQAMREE